MAEGMPGGTGGKTKGVRVRWRVERFFSSSSYYLFFFSQGFGLTLFFALTLPDRERDMTRFLLCWNILQGSCHCWCFLLSFNDKLLHSPCDLGCCLVFVSFLPRDRSCGYMAKLPTLFGHSAWQRLHHDMAESYLVLDGSTFHLQYLAL